MGTIQLFESFGGIMSEPCKMIEVKNGNKTTYRLVPITHEEDNVRDMTTSGRKLMSFGLSKERYEEIFGEKDAKETETN